jgi:histidinol-phosphate aminotransferase
MIYRDRQLLYDADSILQAITPKTKIIVIANPNNPTGNFMDENSFVRIAETGIPFVIDEAYIEYAGFGKSQVALINTYKNVIITRTLSKAYGLAGLRFGYLLADRQVAMQIAAMLLPWNVGTIPMWVALAAIEDGEALAERVKFNNEQIAYIQKALAAIPGLVVFPSQANYILFDAGPAGKKGKDIVDHVEKQGYIIRQEPPKYGSEGWFRITIGNEEENKTLVSIITEFFTK